MKFNVYNPLPVTEKLLCQFAASLGREGLTSQKSRNPANPPRVCLPITLQVLIAIKQLWERDGITHDTVMMWAAATICFFGFFRSGEITVPSVVAFDPTVHVTWGDVTFDNSANPSTACVKLKRSKCDQFGAGVNVHLGRTGSRCALLQHCWHILPPDEIAPDLCLGTPSVIP